MSKVEESIQKSGLKMARETGYGSLQQNRDSKTE